MRAFTNIMNDNNKDVDIWQEISRVMLVIMYAILSRAVTGYHYFKDRLIEYQYSGLFAERPASRYYLSDEHVPFDESHTRVPEDCVYIEEWMNETGNKRKIVRYEGEEIPHVWTSNPFHEPTPYCPWVWVGDKETEIDLTRTFDKFLVAGNRITMDLVAKMVKITDHTKLIYITSGSLKEVEFPGDGITIEADVD